MTSPYRTGKSAPSVGARDGGIVDELVQQFADKFAFLRELVQNALDADATRIDVRVTDQNGGVRVSVRDDGGGMDPEILQSKLLVLFQSGKEDQDDKIGKFGVGFISVLAVKPERVIVSTSMGGALYTLNLASDHTYELFEGEGDGASGTTVTLEVPRPELALAEFARNCQEALRRWCRHAAVPIHFLTALGESSEHVRIDEPLALDAERVVVQCAEHTPFGTILLGIAVAKPRIAFFNRGLTLFESQDRASDSILSHFEVKIQDSRLEHTLSRDNVRRDAAYDTIIAAAESLARDKLRAEVLEAIRRAARRGEEHARMLSVCEAYFEILGIDASAVAVPLLHEDKGEGALPAKSLPKTATFQESADSLSEALARAGHHVVHAAGQSSRFYADELRLKRSASVATAVIPVTPTAIDGALLEELQRSLSTGREPAGCALVELVGLGAGRTCIGAAASPETQVLMGPKALDKNPFRLLRRPELLVNVAHPLVARLRLLAKEDAISAGAMLARLVLSEMDSLSLKDDEALTRAAIHRVLGS